MTDFEELRQRADDLWQKDKQESVKIYRTLIDSEYLPAYPDFLWKIWGDGNFYDEFEKTIKKGIRLGSIDCSYIQLWKEFANRPADDEYMLRLKVLANLKQKNAMLAYGLYLYLYRKERIRGLSLMISSYPCSMCVENLSMILHTGNKKYATYIKRHVSHELYKKIQETPFVPFEPWKRLNFKDEQELLNDNLSNEEFNKEVFTKKRLLERKNIAAGHALSYQDIRRAVLSALPDGVSVIEGLSKNAWDKEKQAINNTGETETSRHSVYLVKKLSDGRYQTLRIGDHTSNIGDYYKYRRIQIPSSRPYANLCLMFHGDREQKASLKYSFKFKEETSDPCVTVRDEDYQDYFPFLYTIVHYVPGLVPKENGLSQLTNSIKEWFNNEGNLPYQDPFLNMENSPSARRQSGIATIETWSFKYKRRELQLKKNKKGTFINKIVSLLKRIFH